MSDHREHSYYPACITEDHQNMTLTLDLEDEDDLIILPAKYEVCHDCDGKGKYVNPAIDGHGLSSEDFDEDPDFREDYFSGLYDVTCKSCQGRNVMLVPVAPESQAQVDEIIQEEAVYWAECMAEISRGA